MPAYSAARPDSGVTDKDRHAPILIGQFIHVLTVIDDHIHDGIVNRPQKPSARSPGKFYIFSPAPDTRSQYLHGGREPHIGYDLCVKPEHESAGKTPQYPVTGVFDYKLFPGVVAVSPCTLSPVYSVSVAFYLPAYLESSVHYSFKPVREPFLPILINIPSPERIRQQFHKNRIHICECRIHPEKKREGQNRESYFQRQRADICGHQGSLDH